MDSHPETAAGLDAASSSASEGESKTGQQGDYQLEDHHTVRFASAVQVDEIPRVETKGSGTVQETFANPWDSARALQGRRMSRHFESLPIPSRAPSYDSASDHDRSKATSPIPEEHHKSIPTMQSPPLTPAVSGPTDSMDHRALAPSPGKVPAINEPTVMPPTITPQQSTSREHSPPVTNTHEKDAAEAEKVTAVEESLPALEKHVEEGSDHDQRLPYHRRGVFSLGGESGRGSAATSRDASPSRASAYYSRPPSPTPDEVDPYAASKRPPPLSNPSRKNISPRFQFPARRKSPPGTTEKRHSGLLMALKADDGASIASGISGHNRSGSFASLRRIWRRMASNDGKRETSPSPPAARAAAPTHRHGVPFSEDHSLGKYGKFDRVLGSGAGGSVRLLKRDDGTVFAVKEFRARHSNESERKYHKKVTSEFCIGSALSHGNVIETLDIVKEKGRWYEVMEYAPYDLFSIVMSGKMSREEVTCSWLQILNGVTFIHSHNVAHRDLKLDNVVVNAQGIMKIIDFGSAFIFRHNKESKIMLAEGVVGSDPYMAPEVYDKAPYDARLCDIWSLAIIYCCMSLRRFPWKIPLKAQDKSFRLFSAEPRPGHDPRHLLRSARSESDLGSHGAAEHNKPSHDAENRVQGEHTARAHSQGPAISTATSSTPDRKEVVYGPWRILRLLPRESRYVIWRMLEVNPAGRIHMEEILTEPWIANTIICQEIKGGHTVLPGPDHTHTLVAPSPQEKES